MTNRAAGLALMTSILLMACYAISHHIEQPQIAFAIAASALLSTAVVVFVKSRIKNSAPTQNVKLITFKHASLATEGK